MASFNSPASLSSSGDFEIGSSLIFEHPAQYLVLREYRQAIEDAEARLKRLTQQVADVVSTWSMAPVVEAYQAMRGVAFLTAVTFVAEIGDVRRFETPRQLMAYLGLVPSERSTGEQVRRGSITKAGNKGLGGESSYELCGR